MQRLLFLKQLETAFKVHNITALLGPRQCGKTTLAKQYCAKIPEFSKAAYFDLENPTDLERLKNPKLAFEPLTGLIVIDEIQRRPDLFPVLRYIHDENPDKRFLILGSASRDLIHQSSESLAGRIGYLEVTPFLANELQEIDMKNLWLRGGFPRSFLASDNDISYTWRRDYVRTYLEQDIPALGINIPAENIRRFWMMLSHYHGQVLNSSELAGSLGFSRQTITKYLDLLAATFMVRVLKPWFVNIKKRQIKNPKIYLRDSGIFHYFLNIKDQSSLLTSPKLGASWEGFALEQVVQGLRADIHECYFWGTHNRAELDLLVIKDGKKLGFEFKFHDAPKITPSMKIALEDLELDKLTVIYPGTVTYLLNKDIEVIGLTKFLAGI